MAESETSLRNTRMEPPFLKLMKEEGVDVCGGAGCGVSMNDYKDTSERIL